MNNDGNSPADTYLEMRGSGLSMKVGAILAKDSFAFSQTGEIVLGPLAVMEKMPAGFNELVGNWKFMQMQPDGSLLGETNGENAEGVQYCMGCHHAREDTDCLLRFPKGPTG